MVRNPNGVQKFLLKFFIFHLKIAFVFQYCTFKACRDGIQFVVDDHNFQQANAYLKTEIFSELDVRVDEVRLRVPMNILAV
jgi:hypothetical protein